MFSLGLHLERELDVLMEDQVHLDRLIHILFQLEYIDIVEVRDEGLGVHQGCMGRRVAPLLDGA